MLLIGSHAINHYLPGFRPKPGDVDVIAMKVEVERLIADGFVYVEDFPHSKHKNALRSPAGVIWDIEIESPFTSELTDQRYWVGGRAQTHITGYPLDLPTLDQLYTLKLSHRYLKNSPFFMKTMLDIYALRTAGAQVFNEAWLASREKMTYHYQHPNLMRDKGQFFTGDSVAYVYDHDSIHQAVKLEDVPAYTRFSTPGQEVFSSRARFDALDETYKLHAVLEESYVLAMERSQIPFPGTSPHRSFVTALEKVCTSITSGWFREYAWENYFMCLTMYESSYVDRFNAALAAGVVKPHTPVGVPV